jgi:hypothetical protein
MFPPLKFIGLAAVIPIPAVLADVSDFDGLGAMAFEDAGGKVRPFEELLG